MHHTCDESKLIGGIAAVLADIVPARLGISPDELADVGGLGEHIGGVAELGNLGNNGSAELKDVFAPEQKDVDAALFPLLVEIGRAHV